MINYLLPRLTFAATLVMLPAATLATQSAACTGAVAVGATCDDNASTTAGDKNTATLTGQLGDIINAVFVIIGIISVIVLLYGAIRYITSTGDAKRIQAAKDTIIYALAGLVVAILARAIVGFVISRFGT